MYTLQELVENYNSIIQPLLNDTFINEKAFSDAVTDAFFTTVHVNKSINEGEIYKKFGDFLSTYYLSYPEITVENKASLLDAQREYIDFLLKDRIGALRSKYFGKDERELRVINERIDWLELRKMAQQIWEPKPSSQSGQQPSLLVELESWNAEEIRAQHQRAYIEWLMTKNSRKHNFLIFIVSLIPVVIITVALISSIVFFPAIWCITPLAVGLACSLLTSAWYLSKIAFNSVGIMIYSRASDALLDQLTERTSGNDITNKIYKEQPEVNLQISPELANVEKELQEVCRTKMELESRIQETTDAREEQARSLEIFQRDLLEFRQKANPNPNGFFAKIIPVEKTTSSLDESMNADNHKSSSL